MKTRNNEIGKRQVDMLKPSKEELERMYITCGLSQCDIAKTLNTNPRYVFQWVKEYGILKDRETIEVDRRKKISKSLKQVYKRGEKKITMPTRVLGVNVFPKGKRPHNYNGGRFFIKTGYVKLSLCNGKTVLEHVYKMEQYIGRKLKKGEVIHHKNGIKCDNRLENLQLCSSQSEHRKLHYKLKKYLRDIDVQQVMEDQ